MKGLGVLPFHLLRPRACADAIEGWLAYGAALNEGRALFHPEDDKGFGQWVSENVHRQLVGVEPNDHERAAAMWAAAEELNTKWRSRDLPKLGTPCH